ncbi:MAG: BCD family MFS transporter [Alphaproteobacteria bacterium]|nr:BCD family MFS transporter [Alphaproteobacteria bacterium]
MSKLGETMQLYWKQHAASLLPFADAASTELPLARLLRLSLFQVAVGMAIVLLNGTLNRVMIVEMAIPAWLVSVMIALPMVFAPLRALIGFKSDTHRSFLGWRRVPYIWFGSMLQFIGLAIMPFALILLSGDTNGPLWVGDVAAGVAFLLIGAGLHTTQTAGLALANDIAPEASRPRTVAFLYMVLLVGMGASALLFSWLLADFSQEALIKVIQGAAFFTMVLNVVALWKQEVRRPDITAPSLERPRFRDAWRTFSRQGRALRLLVVVALGTAAFSMQDILLEPYGGEILGLSVGQTTLLTGIFAAGTLAGLFLAAWAIGKGLDSCRLAALGALVGLPAFAAVIFAAPLDSALLFRIGTVLIGLGAGLFTVGTLTAAMALSKASNDSGETLPEDGFLSGSGLILGAWGAVQATTAGIAIALGGIVRDVMTSLGEAGALGPALTDPSVGYSAVYHIEIVLLFFTLAAVGPLVRGARHSSTTYGSKFGMAEFPG